MVSGAWQPALTDVQEKLWLNRVMGMDAKAAFAVLTRSFKTEGRRPSAPEFYSLYRHELMDTTAVAPSTPEGRDDMPQWVKGWYIAAAEGDNRLWPEMERGSRQLDEWHRPAPGGAVERSGYEWDANVQALGMMPQADRIKYMERAREGEGPRSIKDLATLGGEPESDTRSATTDARAEEST